MSRKLGMGLLGLGAAAACAESPTEPPKDVAAPVLATASLGTWMTKASMPTARRNLTAAVVPNSAGHSILYAIGGNNRFNPALKRVEAYNAGTNAWIRKTSLPAKRAGTNGAGVIGGKIYVTGGFD